MASGLTSGGQQKRSRGAKVTEFIAGSKLIFTGTTANPSRLQPPRGTLPSTCTVGEIFVDSSTNTLKICTAANTWTSVGAQT